MKNKILLLLLLSSSLNLFGATHILKFNLDRINKNEIRYTLIPDENSTLVKEIFFPGFISSNYFEIANNKLVNNVQGYNSKGKNILLKNENSRFISSDKVSFYEIDITRKPILKDLKPALHPIFKKNKFVSLALSTICPVFSSQDSILIKIKDDFAGDTQIDSFFIKGDEVWKYHIAKSKYTQQIAIDFLPINVLSSQKLEGTVDPNFISTALQALSKHLNITLPEGFTIFLDFDTRKSINKHSLPTSEIFQNGIRIWVRPELDVIGQKEQILRALAWQLYRFLMPLQLADDRIENVDPLLGRHSIHIWWYESVTEYLSLTALVGTKLIEEDYFRQIILNKIVKSIESPNYSLIQLASDYYGQNEFFKTRKNLKTYDIFHNRGILAAMMLDISLLSESRSLSSLNDQFMSLVENDHSIQSTLFINELTKDKNDLYKQMVEHYIFGIEAIAFESTLELIDWQFFRKGEEHKTFIKGGYVAYFPEILHYVCVKKGKNTVGLEKGDIILSVNGQQRFNLLDLNEIVFGGPNLRNQGRVKIEVLRNNHKLLLRGVADMAIKIKKHTIMPLYQPNSDAYHRRLKLLQYK